MTESNQTIAKDSVKGDNKKNRAIIWFRTETKKEEKEKVRKNTKAPQSFNQDYLIN